MSTTIGCLFDRNTTAISVKLPLDRYFMGEAAGVIIGAFEGPRPTKE